jgi:riboflavin synthase alpha subunit
MIWLTVPLPEPLGPSIASNGTCLVFTLTYLNLKSSVSILFSQLY